MTHNPVLVYLVNSESIFVQTPQVRPTPAILPIHGESTLALLLIRYAAALMDDNISSETSR